MKTGVAWVKVLLTDLNAVQNKEKRTGARDTTVGKEQAGAGAFSEATRCHPGARARPCQLPQRRAEEKGLGRPLWWEEREETKRRSRRRS